MSKLDIINKYYKKKKHEEYIKNKKEKEINIYYKKEKCEEYLKNKKKKAINICYNLSNNVEKAYSNCFSRAPNFYGTLEEFKNKIENSFTDNMSWENYGEWEIDHIIPLARKGKHSVNNIQALWASENKHKWCNLN